MTITERQAVACKKRAARSLRDIGVKDPADFRPQDMDWAALTKAAHESAKVGRSQLEQITERTSEAEASDLETAFDGCMALYDSAKAEMDYRDSIGNRSARPGGEPAEEIPTRTAPSTPDVAVDASGHRVGESVNSGWRDKNGNPIAVLTGNQRMADFASAGNRSGQDVGFGDLLRAIAFGPKTDAEKRALGESTPSAGGYSVPSPLADRYIDRLRANSAVMRAGASTVPMTSNSLQIARLETDPSFSFKAENDQMSDNSPTMSAITFAAKTCVSLVRASQELLEDTVNANEMLLNAFAQAGALKMDSVALVGSGSGGEPEGILSRTDINELTGLGTPNYDMWLDAMFELENDNVPGPYASIAHPDTFKQLRKTKDNDGRYQVPPPVLGDVQQFSTTQLPIDTGASPNEVEALLARFSDLYVGVRRELTVRTLDERYADFNQVGFLAVMRFDVQVAHPESFCALRGLTTS